MFPPLIYIKWHKNDFRTASQQRRKLCRSLKDWELKVLARQAANPSLKLTNSSYLKLEGLEDDFWASFWVVFFRLFAGTN